jgi:carboxyl-terminal processing protease
MTQLYVHAIRQICLPAIVAVIALMVNVGDASAQERAFGDTRPVDRQVSRRIASIMSDDHLSARPLDDAMSERAFDQYIKNLDPLKVYFLQSDIKEFSIWRNDLDDQLKSGEFDIAFAVYKRYLKRINERVDTALEWIDAEHDFTVDEELETDRDQIEFAADEAAAKERWRKRIKYNLLVERTNKDAKTDAKDKLRKRYTSFARRMGQTDNGDVLETYVSSITTAFDPHTSYMSKESFENFLINMRLELEGIGATLQSTDDGYTVIKRIVPNGAADKQGDLKVEDKIVAVGQGKEGEPVDVTGWKLDEVVKMIRGRAGTVVRLSVFSEKSAEIRSISIVREKIELEDEAARGIVFENEGKKIGVIELPSFYADMSGDGGTSTTKDVRQILDDFNDQNVDALVLDLRRNGGGSLREAIDCTGLFIDEGPVVQVKDAYGAIQVHEDEVTGMSWSKPMVVMTSKFSASASEILAGAVQDYGRGIIVGDETTHGKGTVQSLIDLDRAIFRTRQTKNQSGALKITMQQFYRPNGDSTQKRGVLADIILPSITQHMDVGESDLDFPVDFDQIPRARFSNLGQVDGLVLDTLRKNSMRRVSDSEKFVRDEKRIKQYLDFKDRTSVTLNEEKFAERRKEFNAEEEDKNTIEEQINAKAEIKRDYYMEEVLDITSDFLKLSGKG